MKARWSSLSVVLVLLLVGSALALLSAGPAAMVAPRLSAAPLASGGPDDFGYIYTDSVTAPALYNWIDIAASGTPIALSNPDTALEQIDLPDTFTFYGNDYTRLYVTTNGYASFHFISAGDIVSQCHPAERQPPESLAAFCTDLWGDTVYYSTTTAYNGNQALIVQYDSVTHTASSLTTTFQIVLDLVEDTVTYQYLSVPAAAGVTSSVGIIGYASNWEDALVYCQGTDGCPPQAAMAVRFSLSPPPRLGLTLSPSDHFPEAGETITYTLVLSNSGAEAPGAVMTNTLPAGLNYVSGTLQATGGTPIYQAAGRTVRWDGELLAGTPVTLTYAATLDTSRVIYNSAVLSHPLALESASTTSSPAEAWEDPGPLDAPHKFDDLLGSWRHVAVDGNGVPHIAYAGASLYYATLSGTTWISETVPGTVSNLRRAALALDEQERALIAFYGQQRLWLARQTGAGWTVEEIAEIGWASTYFDMELARGSDGRLHLVYNELGDTSTNSLYYTSYDGTHWLTPTLAIAYPDCAAYKDGFSLALDAGGTPHVACVYKAAMPREVRVYTHTAAAPWTNFTTVVSGTDFYYYPDLAFAGDTPHLAFFKGFRALYHAEQDSGGWQASLVDDSASTDYLRQGVALDVAGGQVGILAALRAGSYGDYTTTLHYVTPPPSGEVWTVRSVATLTYAYDDPRPTLALDGAGRAHLAYYSQPDETLRYAAEAAGFEPVVVDERRTLGSAAAALSDDGAIHVAWSSQGLRYAVSAAETTTWTRQMAVAEPGMDSPSLSLAVDGADRPHLAYGQNGAPLCHATLSGTAWITRAVDVPGNVTGFDVGAELTGTAHIAYIAEQGGEHTLRHAAFDGATWLTETLAVVGPATWGHDQKPQLVAQGGKVHVLYADCTRYQASGDYPITLKVATWDGSAWEHKTLHEFTGQCNWQLTYRLADDEAGRVGAVAHVNSDSVRPRPLVVTSWIEDASGQRQAAGAAATGAADVRSPAQPAGARAPAMVSYVIQALLRGDGGMATWIENAIRYSQQWDREGHLSGKIPVEAGKGSTVIQDGAGKGGRSVLVEENSEKNELSVPRTRMKPVEEEASAIKTATAVPFTAGVFPGEGISYKIDLSWKGPVEAEIVVTDPYPWPRVEFVTGTLEWGAYIVECQHNAASHSITCSGAFPDSEEELSTYVAFQTRALCDLYTTLDTSGPVRNRASVQIGSHFFNPTASTNVNVPLSLKSSTPKFIPQNDFSPGHGVLLYTTPKGVVGEKAGGGCCTACELDVYVVVDGDTAHPLKLENAGEGILDWTHADLIPDDCHHSLWFRPTEDRAYTLELYVVKFTDPFEPYYLADTLRLEPTTTPALATLTDLESLFHEFNRTQDQSARQDSDADCVKDFYQLVARTRQYAADHNGVVIDVRQDAYQDDYDYENDVDRDMMDNALDWLVSRLPAARLEYIAIIGDDAVLPFYRYPDPLDDDVKLREREYLTEAWWGDHGVATVQDTQDGFIMSDVPYSTQSLATTNVITPDYALGRIFASQPLTLVTMIDAYEKPVIVGAQTGSAFAFNLKNEPGGIQWAENTQYAVINVLKGGGYTTHTTDLDDRGKPGYRGWMNEQVFVNWDAYAVAKALNKDRGNRLTVLNSHAKHLRNDVPVGKPFQSAYIDGLAPFPGAVFVDFGCHAGYSTGYDFLPATWDYYHDALTRAALERHFSYHASTTYGHTAGGKAIRYNDRIHREFLYYLLHRASTTGEAHLRAVKSYNDYGEVRERDTTALYGTELYGLPTQAISRSVTKVNVRPAGGVRAARSTADTQAALFGNSAQSITISLASPHFDVSTGDADHTWFELPHGGELTALGDGPYVPLLVHRCYLPAQTSGLNVTLVASDTAAYPGVVQLPLQQAGNRTFGVSTIPFSGTARYPGTPFWTTVYTDGEAVRLVISAIPLQYDPPTGQVTLIHRMDFRVDYSLPAMGVQLGDITLGAPVELNQAALPISVTLSTSDTHALGLEWVIEDQGGAPVRSGQDTFTPTAGTHVLAWSTDSLGWLPGPKVLHVLITDAGGVAGSSVIASGQKAFVAQGYSLELASSASLYGSDDSQALVVAEVRDESGAEVAGLAGDFTSALDGSPQALAWHGSGVYTAALDLAALATGTHRLEVIFNDLAAETVFEIDRIPPSSTLDSPGVVYSPTITVSISGGDELSGIDSYQLQYRVGAGGAWTDWLTRRAGWDYSTGDEAELTLTFGPTQPVTLVPNTPYAFRVRAVDRAGNEEAEHATPDTTTSYVAALPCNPPAAVEITGALTAAVSTPASFSALVQPLTDTSILPLATPLTYTWEASGQASQTHVVSDRVDTATFTWTARGAQAITVTVASPCAVTVHDTHAITIRGVYRLYLPLVLRNTP